MITCDEAQTTERLT